MNRETSSFAFGFQSAKGSAAANFVRGIFSSHRAFADYNVLRAENEHRGIHQRPSSHQTTGERGDVIVPFSASFALRPYLIGHVLMMAGYGVSESTVVTLTLTGATGGTFTLTVSGQETGNIAYDAAAGDIETALELLSTVTVATVTGSAGGPWSITVDSGVDSDTMEVDGALLTGTTPTAALSGWAVTHTFTEADVDDIGYGSLVEYLGEGSSRYGLRAVDGKINNLAFNATRTGVGVTVGGFAITPGDALGSEVEVDEIDMLLHPLTGSFALTSSDITAVSFGTPRTHEYTHDNSLDDTEQELHTIYRASFAENGRKRNGKLGGLVFSEDPFRELMYAGGAAPVLTIPEAQLVWSFESNSAFTGSTKYGITFTMPNCEVELEAFDIAGAGKALYAANYTVRDSAVTSPTTIVLVNDYASYAGS